MLLGMLIHLSAAAQMTTVSGKVYDDKGLTIPGATVRVKGFPKRGTVTDIGGNFKIQVNPNETLVISAIGLEAQEVSAKDNLVIKMKPSKSKLREVVVTALGVKKEKRTLAYATTQVNDEVITQGQNGNAVNALTGKIAGLQITNSSGTPGAASFIQLRGINSIELNTQPLFVVDGIPIDNSSSSFGDPADVSNVYLNNISGSSRALDINPEDIESVSVLKGPGATALYGSLGSNGVIMITTKKGSGKGRGGVSVSYNTALTWDKVNKLPELQNQYLQGRGGVINMPTSLSNPGHFRESWGPRGDTMSWDGATDYPWDQNGRLVSSNDPSARTAFTPYDNVGDFFTTGLTWNNTISLASASEKSYIRMSFGNLKQDGIVPNSNLRRNTVNVNVGTQARENFMVNVGVNYSNTRGTYVQQGSNLAGIMLGLMRTPINFDNSNGYSDPVNTPEAYLFPDGRMRSFRGFGIYDNPYYTVNENLYNDQTNRILGNITLDYQPFSWLNITNRIGADVYGTNSQQNFGTQTIEIPVVGRVAVRNENFQRFNNDLIATITPYVHKDWDLSLLLGQNIRSEANTKKYTRGDNLIVPGLYNLNNALNIFQTDELDSKFRTLGEYGEFKVGYKDYLYAGVTGRIEHATSFWPNFKANTYGSIFGSFIFSDALKIDQKVLNYGKIRASLASAGQNPPAQSTFSRWLQSDAQDGWTNGNTSPINGQSIYETSILFNPDLNPEKTRTFEIGTELRFLKNRVRLDYTFYNSLTKDIFVKVPVAASAGNEEYFTNAGTIRNKGHEIQLGIMPIRKKDFQWNILVNYSRNRTSVEKLADGVEQIVLNGFTGSQVIVTEDEYGVFRGNGYMRDANGNVLIEDDTSSSQYGYPVFDPEVKNLGNVLPKWLGSINNIFTYKGLNVNFLFDTRQGGVIWNGTRGALSHFGMSKETEGRDSETKQFEGSYGHVGADGKIYHYAADGSEVAGSGNANSTTVPLNTSYYFGGVGSGFVINEPFMEDASWVRLRELGLSYSFAPKWLTKTKYLKGLTLGFVGRNLLLWTKYKGVDPETSLVGGEKAQGLDYFNNPGTKTYGVNLKANF